ncbi:protein FAR-RED IMPAIRED RESPONSE 1-like [Bidens hawaiensis]|uniref:protein FAR-RED IMPAIRED RESPONSE 1-like n=1 Tax=Bidens hawaiensis TaxID=980011 RepID=UPI004049703E
MWHAFPNVMLIDTTYNTNISRWPFVQFVGVTSTLKSFCIAHVVIIRERDGNFTWSLERLKVMPDDFREPRVIVTNRDQALMNSCDIVLPNATKNLCGWHITENIKKKHKSFYRVDIFKDFSYWWKLLYSLPTTTAFDYNYGQMDATLARHMKRDDSFTHIQLLRF